MTIFLSCCVPDSNVLIDFQQAGILEVLFSLPSRWLLPDLTLAEMHTPDPHRLLELGVEEALFSRGEIQAIVQLRARYPALSLPDCANLYLAHREHAILLTGDRLLRRIAENDFGLQVRGTLWLLDHLLTMGYLSRQSAAHALRAMLEAGRRLPRAECERRLERWERS